MSGNVMEEVEGGFTHEIEGDAHQIRKLDVSSSNKNFSSEVEGP